MWTTIGNAIKIYLQISLAMLWNTFTTGNILKRDLPEGPNIRTDHAVMEAENVTWKIISTLVKKIWNKLKSHKTL